MAEGLLKADPTEGVDATCSTEDGWHTMTEAERAQYRAHYPVGTKARAAFEVLHWTALRVSDAARLGPQHVRLDPDAPYGVFELRQQKTGELVIQDIEREMKEPIDAYPKPVSADNVAPLAFLLTHQGKPYSSKGLANAFKNWCAEAGLRHCSAHSCRQGRLTERADAGANSYQIAAQAGHSSPRAGEVYTKKRDQLELQRQCARLGKRGETETKVSNVPDPVDRKAKNA